MWFQTSNFAETSRIQGANHASDDLGGQELSEEQVSNELHVATHTILKKKLAKQPSTVAWNWGFFGV